MGNRLFTEVTSLTGLPTNLISDELVGILGEVGTTSDAVNMKDLRQAMAMYLMEVIGPELEKEAEENFARASAEASAAESLDE